MTTKLVYKGGTGSGNHGHAGRPGKVGGSGSGGSSSKKTIIKWEKSTVAPRPTYRTQKFGNMLSDTIQGEVSQSSDGTWSGWFTNHSNSQYTKFEFFDTKYAATKWVNRKLREWGVK